MHSATFAYFLALYILVAIFLIVVGIREMVLEEAKQERLRLISMENGEGGYATFKLRKTGGNRL